MIVLVQPPEEIGWQSERTHSAWGPTYIVRDCGWCAFTQHLPDAPMRGKLYRVAANGEGMVPYDCPNCGGYGAYAVLVNTPPVWVLPS